MLKTWRNKLLFLLTIFMIWLAGNYGGWWEFIRNPNLEPLKPVPVSKPKMVVLDTAITGWDDHQKTWEIKAAKMWESSDGNIIHFETISEGIIYSVKGNKVTFQAGWARWEKLKNELYIGDGLTAQLAEGSFVTPEAVMNYQSQIIRSEKGIHFDGDEIKLTAQTMEANIDLEQLLLEGNVQLEQGKDHLSAQGVFYDLKNKRYELRKPKGVTLNL